MRYHDYSHDYEYIESHTLGLDDTFEFRCRACGKCCKRRTGLIWTAYDVFRIAQFLGRSMREIIETYCETSVGYKSKFPVVLMKTRGPEQECPFLRDRKYVVHSAKLAVCAVYPLGRYFDTRIS